jgi:hypothetical protein
MWTWDDSPRDEMTVQELMQRDQDRHDVPIAIANFNRAHAACVAAGSCKAAGAACPGTSHTSKG